MNTRAGALNKYLVELGGGYYVVPYEAVTLNGLFLTSLLEPLYQRGSPDDIPWAVMGPDGKALKSETQRTQRYATLQEARDDVATLKTLRAQEAAKQVWKLKEDTDTGLWWMVTNGDREFKAQFEADARWLLELLNKHTT